MRKTARMLWALLLASFCLVLVACGGSGAEGGSGGGGEAAPKVDPAEKFVGTWKLASMESEGITIVGDFAVITGEEGGLVLELKEGSTGTFSYGEDSVDMTWELVDDNTIHAAKAEDADEDAGDDEAVDAMVKDDGIDLAYQDGALVTSWTDEENESEVKMLFNESGTLEGAPRIDMEKATDVESIDQIVGTWNITAMSAAGATMYGSADSLAALYGEETETSLTINEDGSTTFMGQDVTCTLGEDGAAIDLVIFQIPIKLIDGELVIDMSELFGQDMVFLYSK